MSRTWQQSGIRVLIDTIAKQPAEERDKNFKRLLNAFERIAIVELRIRWWQFWRFPEFLKCKHCGNWHCYPSRGVAEERQKFQEAVELLKREVDRRHFLNKLPMMTQKRIKVIIAVRELADEVFAEWLKGVKKK